MRQVTIPMWVADDGSRFDTEQACIDYEMAALFDVAVSDDLFYNDDSGCSGIFDVDDLVVVVRDNPALMKMVHEYIEKHR